MNTYDVTQKIPPRPRAEYTMLSSGKTDSSLDTHSRVDERYINLVQAIYDLPYEYESFASRSPIESPGAFLVYVPQWYDYDEGDGKPQVKLVVYGLRNSDEICVSDNGLGAMVAYEKNGTVLEDGAVWRVCGLNLLKYMLDLVAQASLETAGLRDGMNGP